MWTPRRLMCDDELLSSSHLNLRIVDEESKRVMSTAVWGV